MESQPFIKHVPFSAVQFRPVTGDIRAFQRSYVAFYGMLPQLLRHFGRYRDFPIARYAFGTFAAVGVIFTRNTGFNNLNVIIVHAFKGQRGNL